MVGNVTLAHGPVDRDVIKEHGGVGGHVTQAYVG